MEELKKAKIGQEIQITEGFEIKKGVSGKKVEIKEGDRAIVNSDGLLQYISGNANGMLQKVDSIEVDGYDHSNIAKMLYRRLDRYFGISDYLEFNEIDESRFIEEIEDVLMDIL